MRPPLQSPSAAPPPGPSQSAGRVSICRQGKKGLNPLAAVSAEMPRPVLQDPLLVRQGLFMHPCCRLQSPAHLHLHHAGHERVQRVQGIIPLRARGRPGRCNGGSGAPGALLCLLCGLLLRQTCLPSSTERQISSRHGDRASKAFPFLFKTLSRKARMGRNENMRNALRDRRCSYVESPAAALFSSPLRMHSPPQTKLLELALVSSLRHSTSRPSLFPY